MSVCWQDFWSCVCGNSMYVGGCKAAALEQSTTLSKMVQIPKFEINFISTLQTSQYVVSIVCVSLILTKLHVIQE